MPSNFLLLLPLLAGYVFIHFCFRTYFRAQALDGHRLVFEAALAGFGLLPLARSVILLIRQMDLGGYWQETWYSIAGRVPFLSTFIVELIAAPVCAFVWNALVGIRLRDRLDEEELEVIKILPRRAARVRAGLRALLAISREAALDKAVTRHGNDLQILLHDAALRATEEDPPTVCFTMSDKRVYVGWVTRSPNLRANDIYVSVLPVMSGYRENSTLDLKFTVSYPVDEYFDEASDLVPEDFVVILPLAEIRSARFFDLELYEKIFDKPSIVTS